MNQNIMLLVFVVGMGGFMLWSQWRSRKRYQQKMEQLQVGNQVVTIGGIHGQLTMVNRDENLARLKIAPDVEIEISLGAISRRIEEEVTE